MNFEERLEAVTHTLELVASMQRDSMERMDRSDNRVQQLESQMARMSDTVDKILVAIKQDSENIAALARIAQSHEQRIERLESDS